jgi:uncharacterized protein YbbK (DUF523 family)
MYLLNPRQRSCRKLCPEFVQGIEVSPDLTAEVTRSVVETAKQLDHEGSSEDVSELLGIR